MKTISELAWIRTGKITLRADPYLVIKYPGPRYTALHGPQCAREILGQGIETADAAKAVCAKHYSQSNGKYLSLTIGTVY